MTNTSKLGTLVGGIKKSGLKAHQRSSLYARKKKENTLNWAKIKRDKVVSLPVVSLLDTRVRYLLSQDYLDNMHMKYHEYYHWLAGTEVTEVQERGRYLESRLNMNRKEMRENRELLDNVTERLRSITSELEHTGRGDLKHLHLRQLEYDTIQEEFKLSKMVQKSEFQERETFTMLMNAVRESHETERNYNQRIKMISLIGAILGPFIGYLFSARLNAMRFKRMEEIINMKLNLLSLSTISAIREIHGLEPDVISEPDKLSIIKRIILLYDYIKTSLQEALHSLSTSSSQMLESMKQSMPERRDVIEESLTKDSRKQTEVSKPSTKDVSIQVDKPEEKKPLPRLVDIINIPQLKCLLESVKTIDEKQDNLENLLVKSQELQEANKIEVSVNSSDDEIMRMLQSDQNMVKKMLLSFQDALKILQMSFTKSLKEVESNVDSLSMKITNNSELYIGNLEHSKIMNDMSKSLTDIKSNIGNIEAIYSDDVMKQFSELAYIRGNLSEQLDEIKENRQLQVAEFASISNSLIANGISSSKIEDIVNIMVDILHNLNADSSIELLLIKIDELANALNGIGSLLISTEKRNEYNAISSAENISESVHRSLHELERSMSQHQEKGQALLLEKLNEFSHPKPVKNSFCQTDVIPAETENEEGANKFTESLTKDPIREDSVSVSNSDESALSNAPHETLGDTIVSTDENLSNDEIEVSPTLCNAIKRDPVTFDEIASIPNSNNEFGNDPISFNKIDDVSASNSFIETGAIDNERIEHYKATSFKNNSVLLDKIDNVPESNSFIETEAIDNERMEDYTTLNFGCENNSVILDKIDTLAESISLIETEPIDNERMEDYTTKSCENNSVILGKLDNLPESNRFIENNPIDNERMEDYKTSSLECENNSVLLDEINTLPESVSFENNPIDNERMEDYTTKSCENNSVVLDEIGNLSESVTFENNPIENEGMEDYTTANFENISVLLDEIGNLPVSNNEQEKDLHFCDEINSAVIPNSEKENECGPLNEVVNDENTNYEKDSSTINSKRHSIVYFYSTVVLVSTIISFIYR